MYKSIKEALYALIMRLYSRTFSLKTEKSEIPDPECGYRVQMGGAFVVVSNSEDSLATDK